MRYFASLFAVLMISFFAIELSANAGRASIVLTGIAAWAALQPVIIALVKRARPCVHFGTEDANVGAFAMAQ